MPKQLINTGTTANDNTGDNLRQGATKINNNFNEIYGLLGNGTTLLSRDINLSNNKILFSNKVATKDELLLINGFNFVGCVVYVENEDSLYFSANGTWRKLVIDTSDNLLSNYSDPLSRVSYTGNLTDLGIDDGSAGQVLTANGNRTFSFQPIESVIEGFDGNYNSLTGIPNFADVATSGDYNDLINLPVFPTDLSQFSDNSNRLFSRSYNDLTEKPFIPTDASQLTDDSNVLFDGNYSSLSGRPTLSTVATSGSYIDLINKPTSFDNLTGLKFNLGVTITEFSSDATLSGESDSVVPTENAVKSYVDDAISAISVTQSLNDLTDVNTSGVSNGQTLVYNTGTWSPADLTSIGNFTLSSSTIDTDDSSAIFIVPSVIANSDITVQNDLTVNNLLTVNKLSVEGDIQSLGKLNVAGDIESSGTGTPELFSSGDILLTADSTSRVKISQSLFKIAPFTSAQRDTLSAENGDMIYNTTTNKFQGYANNTWVDLH